MNSRTDGVDQARLHAAVRARTVARRLLLLDDWLLDDLLSVLLNRSSLLDGLVIAWGSLLDNWLLDNLLLTVSARLLLHDRLLNGLVGLRSLLHNWLLHCLIGLRRLLHDWLLHCLVGLRSLLHYWLLNRLLVLLVAGRLLDGGFLNSRSLNKTEQNCLTVSDDWVR